MSTDNTKIQWTDATWSPVRGCSRVSDGCTNCYAMSQAHRFAGPGKPYEGLTTIRRGKVDWTGMARFIPEQLAQPLKWKKSRRIFVNSMSDLFHESLTNEEIAAVFGVMAAAPQHTFQVLTKRPKRAANWFTWIKGMAHPDGGPGEATVCGVFAANMGADVDYMGLRDRWPLPNVWIGTSAENQETYNDRVPVLVHQCPAELHWVSLEPQLGPIRLRGTGHIHLGWVVQGGGGKWTGVLMPVRVIGPGEGLDEEVAEAVANMRDALAENGATLEVVTADGEILGGKAKASRAKKQQELAT